MKEIKDSVSVPHVKIEEPKIILTNMEAAIIKEQYDKGLPMFIFRSGETIKFERN